ncbi:hypothetical protein JCM10450v2_007521 [Rhodotorula kratochvilovae]
MDEHRESKVASTPVPQLVADILALSLSRSPIQYPIHPGFNETKAPSSSRKQEFVHRAELRYLISVPDLDEQFADAFCTALAARIPHDGWMQGLSDAAKAKVDSAILDFEDYPFLSYQETSIQVALQQLFTALSPIVKEVDAVTAYPHGGRTRAVIGEEVAIPKTDPNGRDTDFEVNVDLTFFRIPPRKPLEGWKAESTAHVKTPDPSTSDEGTQPAGLFARLDRTLERDQVLEFEDLEHEHERSLLKKAIISARACGHDTFFLEDAYSFMLALIVANPDSGGTYDVLLSRVRRVTSRSYFVAHIAAFYSREYNLAASFLAYARAVKYTHCAGAPVLGNAHGAAVAAIPANDAAGAGAKEGAGAGASAPDGVGEAVGRGVAGATGASPEWRVPLEDLLSESLVIIYPDGTQYTASRSPHEPALSNSTPSNSAQPPHLTDSGASIEDVDTSPVPVSPAAPQLVSPDVASSRRVGEIKLRKLVGEGISARVYSFELAGAPYVLKIALSGAEEDLEHEIRLLGGQLRVVHDDIVSIEAVCRRSDGRPFTLMRYAGEAPDTWRDLAPEQRISAVLSLLRIHQRAHLVHGDTEPRNVVVPIATVGSSPRWIDWANATVHARCRGEECGEIRDVVGDMRLEEEEVVEIGRRAREEGLLR